MPSSKPSEWYCLIQVIMSLFEFVLTLSVQVPAPEDAFNLCGQ